MKINLKERVNLVKNFPMAHITYYDAVPLMTDKYTFSVVINKLKNLIAHKNIDAVAGIESLGFILGSVLAYVLNKKFILVRKQGKLPGKTIAEKYETNYSAGYLELDVTSIAPGQKVFIVDDCLAGGGTALAAAKLVEKLGGVVAGLAFVMELNYLKGREKIKAYKDFDIFSLVNYD
ncbi:MAG: adenine phosphoribosyltransferase [DPANN group archaeon]|nr:adenine phosphoribosyltransferase [DPANN group archaeon]